jgi:hypothetical protein
MMGRMRAIVVACGAPVRRGQGRPVKKRIFKASNFRHVQLRLFFPSLSAVVQLLLTFAFSFSPRLATSPHLYYSFSV